MDCGDMDPDSAALVLELLLQDSKDLEGVSHGSDWDLARQLQQQEIEDRSTVLNDRTMSLSLDEEAASEIESEVESEIQTSNVDEPSPLLCGACQEYGSPGDVTPVACGELYCLPCLQTIFEGAFIDESRFPPRCCGRPIIPDPEFLTPEIIQQYEEKKIEFETLDRTYCSAPTCPTCIKRESIEADCGTCPACTTTTCTICKAGWHIGDCPADTGLQLLLETATREGWQRCASCGRMVEHNLGCNHMTCHCGHQFCYECNTQWKTCECPLFLEHRLLATAIDQATRENVGPIVPAENHQERVAEMRRTIIEQHACNHYRWTWTAGQGTCNECGRRHRQFTYVCDRCNRVHCADCRFGD